MGIKEGSARYRKIQWSEVIYGIGTILAGAGSLFVAISKLKKNTALQLGPDDE